MSHRRLANLEDGPPPGRTEQPGPGNALLPADGNYAPTNLKGWIEELHPRVVLLSPGIGDWRGLSVPEILKSVKGNTLLRTDRNGWIELATDGDQKWGGKGQMRELKS